MDFQFVLTRRQLQQLEAEEKQHDLADLEVSRLSRLAEELTRSLATQGRIVDQRRAETLLLQRSYDAKQQRELALAGEIEMCAREYQTVNNQQQIEQLKLNGICNIRSAWEEQVEHQLAAKKELQSLYVRVAGKRAGPTRMAQQLDQLMGSWAELQLIYRSLW